MMSADIPDRYVSCDLCGQDTFSVVFEMGRFEKSVRNVICLNCGLVYVNPRKKTEDYRREYYENYSGDEAPTSHVLGYTRNYSREQYDQFSYYLPSSGGVVLDVGCGFGAQLKLISQERDDLTLIGVEPSTAFADYARERTGLSNIISGEWSQVRRQLENDLFDFVILSHTLEHFESPTSLLLDLWKLMKPGAHIFVEVPDLLRPYGELPFYFQEAHLYSFTPETFAKLLEKTGFSAVDSRHGGFSHLRVVAARNPVVDENIEYTAPKERIAHTVDFLERYDLLTNSANMKSIAFLDKQIAGLETGQEPGLLYPYAEILCKREQFEKAEKVLNRLISIDNGCVPAYTRLARMLIKQNRIKDAEKLLFQGAERIPQNVILYQRMAEMYMGQNRLDDAERVLRQGLKRTGDTNTDLLFYLGRVLTEKGEYLQAIESFERILKEDPSILRAYRRLAETQKKLGHIEEAMSVAERALEQAPDDVETMFLLGTLYFDAQRVPESIAMFEKSLEIDPGYKDSSIFLGNIFFMQGDYRKARKFLSKALCSPENDIGVFELLLRTCVILQETPNSSIDLERLAAEMKCGEETQMLLTQYYLAIKDKNSSARWFKRWKSDSGKSSLALVLDLLKFFRRDAGNIRAIKAIPGLVSVSFSGD